MPSIYATPQPVYGRVLIQVNFSDTAAAYARVLRVLADGTSTVVRANTATDTSGDFMKLSGGLATLYDTEAPLDVALTYTASGLLADGVTAIGTASTTGPGDVLASSDTFWLSAPLRPWADQRAVLNVPQEPQCVPESAIFFQSMDAEGRSSRTTVGVVNNRRNPIAMSRIRGGITSTLTLVSRRFIDRDHIITLNDEGDVLMFRGSAAYGVVDQYMSVGEYAVNRLSTDHRRPWRVHQMPYSEQDRPAGLAQGILGNRWDDLCDRYLTFAAATAAGLTWTLVDLGYGTYVPSPTATWFYADIPTNYATYTALNAAFATYEALLEGPF